MTPSDSSGSLPDPPLSDPDGPRPSEQEFIALVREVAAAPPVAVRALLAWTSPESMVGTTLSHFRVERVIGKGGLGVVYEARDVTLDRRVALKLLAPPTGGGESSHARVLQEARAAAKVNDPGVAGIYEAGEAEGVSFIAMEYVDGETLRSALERGPLPWRRVRTLGIELGRALATAHEHGVVHQDLKPENIALTRDGRAKILDFGIASQRGAPRSGEGTFLYMAPTDASQAGVDASTDVYSLGVVLVECGIGVRELRRLPLVNERYLELACVRDALEAARCPAALSSALLLCLSENAAERPRDGLAAVTLFESLLATHEARRKRLAAVVGVGATLCALGVAPKFFAERSHSDRTRSGAPLEQRARDLRLRRLTANVPERPILGMDLSPDGQMLAYADKVGLHLMRVGTAENELVPFAAGAAPSLVRWFRDGTKLAVVVETATKPAELRIVDRRTGASEVVARGDFTSIAVSPDGRMIAFAETNSVGVAEASASGVRRELVRKGAQDLVGDVVFSPNGLRVAYVTFSVDSISNSSVESLPLAGGATTTVMKNARLFNDITRPGMAWLRTGEILVALAEWLPAEAGTNLWSVRVEEATGEAKGELHQRTQWQGITALVLSADAAGDSVAFIRFEAETDIFLGDLSSNHDLLRPPVRFTMTDRNERRPTWDSESRGIYYSSDETGNYDIFYQDLEGHPPVAAAATQAWETSPVVDPAGTHLLYFRLPAVAPDEEATVELISSARTPDHAEKVLMRASTRGAAGGGRPPPWEVRVRCARSPGRGCVVSRRTQSSIVFNRLDSVKGPGEEVYREEASKSGSGMWELSPDGMTLALPTPMGPVRLMPMAKGRERTRELAMPKGCDPFVFSFAADESGLFVTCEFDDDDAALRLFYVPLEGGARLIWQSPPNFILESDPSPDGKHIAIAVKRPDDDVWIVTGLSR